VARSRGGIIAACPGAAVNVTSLPLSPPRDEIDLAWPTQCVLVEMDGWAAHGHRFAFERDRAR
jgi:hypothetical protein